VRRWIHKLPLRFRTLFRIRRVERELDEELRFHLDRQTEVFISQGMTPEGARLAALREFGGFEQAKEFCRDAWGWQWLENRKRDLAFAFRLLRRNPGFAMVGVFALGLGIGVNTAIFSVVDQLLFRPLPVPHPEMLSALHLQNSKNGSIIGESFSYPDYLYFKAHNAAFSGMAAYTETDAYFRFGDITEKIGGEIVSANYFSTLGISPRVGRSFSEEEDFVPDRDRVLILGCDLWQRQYRGDPAIVGRQVNINNYNFTVIGVAPPGFRGLRLDRKSKPQFWVPTMMYPLICRFADGADLRHYGGNQWLSIVGRRAEGVSTVQAAENLRMLFGKLKETEWRRIWKEEEGFADWSLALIPAQESQIPPDSRARIRTFLSILMGVAGLVWLITCINGASLVLSQAMKRQKEIGVRLALGAGRWRLFQQLVSESLLLSGFGCTAGLLIAWLTLKCLVRFAGSFQMELLLESTLDIRLLLFGIALSFLTGILTGVVPLWQAFLPHLVTTMKFDSANWGHNRFGLRNILLSIQVSLSLVMIAGAGLFIQTLRNAQAADVTKDPGKVLLLNLDLRERKYSEEQGKLFYSELMERISSRPGVKGAALVNVPPMGGRRGGTTITPNDGAKSMQVDFNVVSEDYFRLIGLPILRGRTFASFDREGSPLVAVINERMAHRFWPGEDPIGKSFRAENPVRGIGVVGVVRDGRFRNFRDTLNAGFYVPLSQNYRVQMSLEIRTSGNLTDIAKIARQELYGLDKGMLLENFQTLKAYRNSGLGKEHLSAALMSGLGILAICLVAIGLYGVLSFSVSQRTKEIGVRMALGATSGQVLQSVVYQAIKIFGTGNCVGSVTTLLLTRFVSSLLFEVKPNDPSVYIAAIMVLIAICLISSIVPAFRASRIDPLTALHHE
jgi:predicted permease